MFWMFICLKTENNFRHGHQPAEEFVNRINCWNTGELNPTAHRLLGHHQQTHGGTSNSTAFTTTLRSE